MNQNIVVRGARQHNLKNINLDLPHNKLIVITGLSGSGKSTLAFDTLYAEGQRRYVESLSAYARMFLERMEKPDVDLIEGLSPAISIEQKTTSHNPRSTVGTVTEIYDYMRLLFARVGIAHCYKCGKPITRQSLDEMIDQIKLQPEGSRLIISAPLVTNQKGSQKDLIKRLRKDGFARLRIDGQIYDINDVEELDKNKRHDLDVVIDRVVLKPDADKRLADSLELALHQSGGLVKIEVVDGEHLIFNENAACLDCGISYAEFTPASFSFNSPQGACEKCAGLGTTNELDPNLIVPNPELSLREGVLVPWEKRDSLTFIEFIEGFAELYGADIYTPWKNLPEAFKQALLYGTGDTFVKFSYQHGNRRIYYERPYEGLINNLMRRYLDTDSEQMREEIRRYMNVIDCPACNGKKLKPESLAVRVGGKNVAEITALSVEKATKFFQELNLGGQRAVIAAKLVKEINDRLAFLNNVGLSYLTLDRRALTLSGGESQRIRLATQIGSKLTGVLYVLDEPSIGLHQRDNEKLLQSLFQIRDLGNTVLVVEHDEDTILCADYVVDMGPRAGVHGGEVVFAGKPSDLPLAENSLTGQYLSGKREIPLPTKRRKAKNGSLELKGARVNNLKRIDVKVPLGCFTCVTGVSGSGKSSLVLETLYPAIMQHIYGSRILAGPYDSLDGLEKVDKIINVDQAPIGRTPRSNPGTYTGVFSDIRDLFAKTPDAKAFGYKSGRFSFNVKGGRCEACQGDGILKIEMHFLPDVFVTCDVCNGMRYNRETLDVRYKGKNIAEVLDMTVDQGVEFFAAVPSIRNKLLTLQEVGLGYVKIGQSALTLSGGEAQRVKLAKELTKRATGKTVYLLDEPTTGLHAEDISKLLEVLNRLVEKGNTVLVIEHNLDVIKTADYIIDIGPEGGDAGGNIIACGTPEEIAATPESYTGQYLQKILQK